MSIVYSNANCYSNNVNVFIVYANKYASNSFEVEFCFRYKYRQIQRKKVLDETLAANACRNQKNLSPNQLVNFKYLKREYKDSN